jgi:hypothetical protein
MIKEAEAEEGERERKKMKEKKRQTDRDWYEEIEKWKKRIEKENKKYSLVLWKRERERKQHEDKCTQIGTEKERESKVGKWKVGKLILQRGWARERLNNTIERDTETRNKIDWGRKWRRKKTRELAGYCERALEKGHFMTERERKRRKVGERKKKKEMEKI